MDKQALDRPFFAAVIFDLGNVILSFDSRKISGFIAAKSGFLQEEVHGFMFGTELEKAIDRGEITLRDFLDRINDRFRSKIGLEEFTPVWCDMFTQNEGMESIIRGLKENKYRLGILSNTNSPQFEFIMKEFPLIGLFDDYHLSYETGLLKPEKRAFEKLIDFYGREPGSLVFIDDLESNAAAARASGIRAFRYATSQQLASDLSNIGLKF